LTIAHEREREWVRAAAAVAAVLRTANIAKQASCGARRTLLQQTILAMPEIKPFINGSKHRLYRIIAFAARLD
jgi:hypothetical protein